MTFLRMSTFFMSQNISVEWKKGLVKTFGWSITLYGLLIMDDLHSSKENTRSIWDILLETNVKSEWTESQIWRCQIEWREESTFTYLMCTLTKVMRNRRDTLIVYILHRVGLIKIIIECRVEGKSAPGRQRRQGVFQVIMDL